MSTLTALLPKPCPYTHLEGDLIGSRCGRPSNGYRCIAHVGKPWPEKSWACTRIITQGPRKGTQCSKSTKFQDAVCSTCRKCKK